MTNRITDNPPLPHLAAKSANVIPILLVRVLVVLLCSFIFAGLSLELMDDIQGLMAYTLLLLWYLYYEIRRGRRTILDRGGGIYSFVVKIGADIDQVYSTSQKFK